MKHKFIDLGRQPISNAFVDIKDMKKEIFFNLGAVFDDETFLVSLSEFVEKRKIFHDFYPYRNSGSKTMQEHFKNIANKLRTEFKPMLSLEIGSLEGTFMKHFSTRSIISVEPCRNMARITREMGFNTYERFFDESMVNVLMNYHSEMDLVYSANCICHIPEIENVFRNVRNIISDKGVFVFEDPSLMEMLKNNTYSQIYEEHAHIFSVIALDKLLKKADLEIFRVEHLETHGGSNRIYACKKGKREVENSVRESIDREYEYGLDKREVYYQFEDNVKKQKEELLSILKKMRYEGKKIIGYGATSKSTVEYNYCGIGKNLVEYIVDTTPEKIGKLQPGTNLEIREYEKIEKDVDVILLNAWNFAKEILEKEKDFIDRGGKFIIPFPYPKVI